MTITAHGASYSTAAEANARIAELNEENARLGVSDGRVTEILLITEAMQAAGWEQTPREAAAPKRPAGVPTLGELTRQYINEARKDLASIKRTGYDDGKWRYMKWVTPEGRMYRREYRTQAGFLKAYIREASRGSEILIAE
jgi:hypothetical protein